MEHYESLIGVPRGRLAVTMDLVHRRDGAGGTTGVHCQSWPSRPVLNIQMIMKSLTDAKELIQSAMEELKSKTGE